MSGSPPLPRLVLDGLDAKIRQEEPAEELRCSGAWVEGKPLPNDFLCTIGEAVLPFAVFDPTLVEHARVLDAAGMIDAAFDTHAGRLFATIHRLHARGRAQLTYWRDARVGSFGDRRRPPPRA